MARNRITTVQARAAGLLPGTAAPRPKRVRRPAPLVAPAVVLELVVPFRPASEANARHWRQRSRRTQQAVQAWGLTLLWAGVPNLTRLPKPLAITLTRIGGRRMDSDNSIISLKATRDSVAESLGLDDGDGRLTWAYGAWEPGRECGVRVTIRSVAAPGAGGG